MKEKLKKIISKKNLQTPFFIFFPNILDHNIFQLKKNLNLYFTNFEILFSLKTNYLISVISYLIKKNIYPEIISGFEYDIIRKIDDKIHLKKKILINGPVKSYNELIRYIKHKHIIHIDSLAELNLIIKIVNKLKIKSNIGIRLSNEIENNSKWRKFGIIQKDLNNIIKMIEKNPYLNLNGLHFHLGGNIRDKSIYKKAGIKIVAIINKYKLLEKFDFKYIDMGGGFPSKFLFKGEKKIKQKNDYIKSYIESIYKGCGKFVNDNNLKLIIEPGRYLIDDCFSCITSVSTIKKIKNSKYLFIDIGSNALPSMKYKIHEINKLNGFQKKIIQYHVEGPLCMSSDGFISKYYLPKISVGDKLIIEGCGAYSISQSMNFIKQLPDVYMFDGKKIHTLRKFNNINNIIGDEYKVL